MNLRPPRIAQWSQRLLAGAIVLASVHGVRAEVPRPEIEFRELGRGAIELELVLARPHWIRVGPGWVAELPGFGSLNAAGAPELPARRERLAVEPGGRLRIDEVEVEWEEGFLPGPLSGYPARDPDSGGVVDPGRFPGLWPLRAAEIVVPDGALRSLSFATIELRPVQVDLANGLYRAARRIVVRAERTAGRLAASGPRQDALRLDAAESTILGADAVGRMDLGSGPLTESSRSLPANAVDATYPAHQLLVDRDGLYRVSYAWADANAPGLLSFLVATDPRRLRLTVQGVEIPIQVEGEADGVFDAPGGSLPDGDAFVFYGQALEGIDPFDADVWQGGDFTDQNVYRLDAADAPSRIDAVLGTRSPASGYAVPSSFPHTARLEPDQRFQGFVPSDGDDHWFVDPFLISPVCVDTGVEACTVAVDAAACGSSCSGPGEVCCAAEESLIVSTPGHAGGAVDVRVAVMGIRGTEFHRTEVEVAGEVIDQTDWDGFSRFTHGVDQGPLSFDPGGLLGSGTSVTVRVPLGRTDGLGASVLKDWIAYDWVELGYERTYDADSEALAFTVTNADSELRIGGFATTPEIWETSETVSSVAGMAIALPSRAAGVALVADEARVEVDERAGAQALRRFVAAAGSGFLVPSGTREDLPPSEMDPLAGQSLRDPSLGADWVVVGRPDLLDRTPGSSFESLVAHRQSQGLQTLVVDVFDIYDDFTEGIEEPQAIRDFVRYTLENWNPAPSYFVIVGDASWDHKNNYGNDPPRQLVPVYMFDLSENTQFGYHPSDNWMVAVLGGDDLPDAALGRIPAHTMAEAENVFSKLVDYETGPQPASWSGRALLVSEFEAETGSEFFRVHDEIFDRWFASGPQTASKIYEEDPAIVGCQVAADNQNASIDSALNTGAAIKSFAGHGGFKNWGKSCGFFITDHPGPDDLDDVLVDTPLPFTVQANCITGNFAATSSPTSTNDSWYSFVEDWLLADRKGVIGGFAPSHLSFTFELDVVLDSFYEEVFGKRKERVVGAIDAAMRSQFDSLNKGVLVRSFILQADPALRIAVPAPPAPTILSIDTAGSGELQLSWTAVPEAASYRVYRSFQPGAAYELVTETAATSFTDDGLTNCNEYYYYVVAVDADGFESRWSNYNEDCFGAAADCASGTPENPTAPAAPQLLSVVDTQNGGELQVDWDNSAREADLLRYRVSWGTEPGVYLAYDEILAENSTYRIRQLENGVEYFVSVRGFNCSQGGPSSNELSGIPRLVRGINPPRAIRDLEVFVEADPGDGLDDVRLSWTAPVDSVWGTAITLQSMEVHGSTAGPAFVVDDASRLASLPAGAGEWIHEDQAALGAPDWYYVVVAVDSDGVRSAAGAELPAAVDDLTVEKVPGGAELRLSWSPVTGTTSDSASNPPMRLIVKGYNVYGRDSVLPRAETGPSNLVQAEVDGTSLVLPVPAGTLFTYQVLAEDYRGSESVW